MPPVCSQRRVAPVRQSRGGCHTSGIGIEAERPADLMVVQTLREVEVWPGMEDNAD